MLALREGRTEEFICLFFKFIAVRFLWTHRLYCILSYILLLDIEVTVNWHIFSLSFSSFLVLKRGRGWCGLGIEIVLCMYVPHRLQDRYIDS